MEKLSIEETSKTPGIKSDPASGVINIKGRSLPENSIEFYKPLINWAEEYVNAPQQKTTVNIQLELFNTSSSKCILDLLKRLEALQESQKEVLVNWYYEEDDEELLEAGEVYSNMVKIPFNMIETPEE